MPNYGVRSYLGPWATLQNKALYNVLVSEANVTYSLQINSSF